MPGVSDRKTKQVIVIRRDLGMRRGKEIAQGAHASMAWLGERLRAAAFSGPLAFSEAERSWLQGPFTKVAVQVPDEAALLAVFERAKAAGVLAHLIRDAGLTEFGGVPTHTALGVGPDYADRVDAVTGDLKLY
jgi:PTH2 family peptidyl-tRNA hydrolase